MSAIESAGSFTMPPLTGTLDGLWEVILDLADNLPPMSWELVGGQMVMAHGLAAGRTPTRASQDIDVLGNLITSSKALRTAVAAVRELGFKPEPSMDGRRQRLNQPETLRDTRDDPGQRFGQSAHLPGTRQRPAS